MKAKAGSTGGGGNTRVTAKKVGAKKIAKMTKQGKIDAPKRRAR
jgi:hypothetical protein